MPRMTMTPELKTKRRTIIRQWLTLVRQPERRLDEQAHLAMLRTWSDLNREPS